TRASSGTGTPAAGGGSGCSRRFASTRSSGSRRTATPARRMPGTPATSSAWLEHGRRDALDALERELDNFRAALAWSERAEPAAALELTAALSGSWYARDQLVEGRRWLEAALTGDHSPSRELAVIAAELARLLFLLGELQAAAKPLARALELADALGLQDVLADATTTGGILAGSAGRHEEAAALLAQALAIAREHD